MNNQTSIIAAALVIAWVVFITVRGELQGYMAILGIGSGAPAGGSTISGGVTQASNSGTPITQTGPLTPVDPSQISSLPNSGQPGTAYGAGGFGQTYGAFNPVGSTDAGGGGLPNPFAGGLPFGYGNTGAGFPVQVPTGADGGPMFGGVNG